VNNKAPDLNDLVRMHGIDYLRDYVDANGRRFDRDKRPGRLDDEQSQEATYVPPIIHEAQELISRAEA
jgi:hypothetical protein